MALLIEEHLFCNEMAAKKLVFISFNFNNFDLYRFIQNRIDSLSYPPSLSHSLPLLLFLIQVSFHPSGNYLVSSSLDETVRLHNLLTVKPICTLTGHEKVC